MAKKPKKTQIKAIIFDFGNVLYFANHMKAAKSMSKILRVSSGKIYEIISSRGIKPGFSTLSEEGATPKEYWGFAMKKLGVNKNPYRKLQSLWNNIFIQNKILYRVLPKIKQKYKLVLLSNMDKGHKAFLKTKYKLGKKFDEVIFSCDVRVRKPNPEIYKIAIKRLNIEPKEAVFIDDFGLNVKAAKKLGMHTILFKTNKQLFKQLKQLGVRVK